jgi:16S rRNA (cytosine967-C5)-methyltransferase
LALRVLERVQRAGAYADLLLHSTLARSSLNAPDRAFATEIVYGTLRWRGRIDYMLGRCLEGDLEKLEPMVATALRLGAYQILFTASVPATAAVDESPSTNRCVAYARAAASAPRDWSTPCCDGWLPSTNKSPCPR